MKRAIIITRSCTLSLACTLFIHPEVTFADLYVTSEGGTIELTNTPSREQKRKGKRIHQGKRRQRSHSSHQTCHLENKKTGVVSLTTDPTPEQLKESRVVWCRQSTSGEESESPASDRQKITSSSPLSKRQMSDKRRGQHSLPKRAEAYRGFVEKAAAQYELPEALIWAFMKVESDFVPTVVSRVGAQGLMQLMPFTARDMGVKDPFDPEQNILGAAKLIHLLMKRFNRELPLVISAYHAGGGAVTQREGIPYSQTSQYMTSVLNAYYRYMNKPPYLKDTPSVSEGQGSSSPSSQEQK